MNKRNINLTNANYVQMQIKIKAFAHKSAFSKGEKRTGLAYILTFDFFMAMITTIFQQANVLTTKRYNNYLF